MRYGQTLLAMMAGVGLTCAGVAHAEEAQPSAQPPIVVQPPPDTPVIVQPAEPAPLPMTEVPAPPPMYAEPPPAAPPPAPPPAPRAQKHEKKHNRWFAPGLAAVTVGGGVADFVGGSMRGATETGAEWDARVTLGTRSFLAVEAGYAGTYNKLQSPVEGAGSVAPYMVNNSVDGDLRLNLLPFRIQPYIFGGVGYNRATINNLNDSPAMAQRFNSSDDQLLVPAGGGLALYPFTHGLLDARFTYRAIFADNLDRADPNGRLDQWVVTGRFGYAF